MGQLELGELGAQLQGAEQATYLAGHSFGVLARTLFEHAIQFGAHALFQIVGQRLEHGRFFRRAEVGELNNLILVLPVVFHRGQLSLSALQCPGQVGHTYGLTDFIFKVGQAGVIRGILQA